MTRPKTCEVWRITPQKSCGLRREKPMKRIFHPLSCLCTAAHHAFELGAGGGLVFQQHLGLRRSLLLWSGLLATWSVGAASARPGWERPRAVAAGMSLGGALIHFLVWPWARPGVPMLTEPAEGLPSRYLPAYNLLLYVWAAVSLTAIVRETPVRYRAASIAGLMASLPLMPVAQQHFRYMQQQARQNPAWWNRAYRETLTHETSASPPL
jgi:hypothetical protein